MAWAQESLLGHLIKRFSERLNDLTTNLLLEIPSALISWFIIMSKKDNQQFLPKKEIYKQCDQIWRNLATLALF